MKKVFFWAGGLVAALGIFNNEPQVGLGMGGMIIALYFILRVLWGGAKVGAKTTSNIIGQKIADSKEQKQWNKAQARDKARWEEELRRKLIEEEQLSRVRNTSMIEMYKTQVDLMMKYKKEGANIDKDIFAMREKLLVLEGQENKAMVQDLMNTLSGL